ncbi:unnamed protein product [Trichobilharzia regenti]|nr:unnamed protein product [Trichobilharzia regenti]
MAVSDNSTVLDPCSDPDAVMKEYFDRYVEAGEWDWASWNNYLSWIARTNPQCSEQDANEDNENDWTYCSTCDQNFGTERAFTLHLRGIMHTRRILQSSEMYEADFAVPEENWETKHHKWLKSQYLNNGHSVVGFSGSFFCEVS